jgi:putative transposase
MNPSRTQYHRRSIRLQGYDYSQAGAYFVTLVIQNRAERFGTIHSGEMVLNQAGQITVNTWQHLSDHYAHVKLDEFCVMPNHVHGIIVFEEQGAMGLDLPQSQTATADGRGGFQTRPYDADEQQFPLAQMADAGQRHPLSEIVRAFKTFSARRIHDLFGGQGQALWQRNYYEHIIRSDEELERIRIYIAANPHRWAEDTENPGRSRR